MNYREAADLQARQDKACAREDCARLAANYVGWKELLFPLNGEQPQKIRPGKENRRCKGNGRKAWEGGYRSCNSLKVCLWGGDGRSYKLGSTSGFHKIVGSIVAQVERFRNFAAKQGDGQRKGQESAKSFKESHDPSTPCYNHTKVGPD